MVYIINSLNFAEVINRILINVYKPYNKDSSYFEYIGKYYYRRESWAPGYFIKYGLYTNSMNLISSDDINELSIGEISEKVKNGDVKLGLYYVYCIVNNDSIIEKDIIINNHCVNNDDLFACDWEVYII